MGEKGEGVDKKSKPLALFCMVLLVAIVIFALFDSIIVVTAPEPAPTVAIAEYDYYVVAGYNMTPTLPSSAPQPFGFTFTCIANNNATSTGYNFGSVDTHDGRDYLYDGCAETSSPYNDNAYVTLDITNNLGYAINIEDLTAEVTGGTPTEPWLFGWGPDWGMGNMSVVAVDTLDPWDPGAATSYDEVNYHSGIVTVHRDPSMIVRDGPFGIVRGYPDWFRKATGIQGWPYLAAQLGPGSLLENDLNGDAAATGHVKPVALANGSTLTEYFGITIFGVVEPGAQIDATITLRLTYSPPPEGTPAVCDVRIVNLVPFFPEFPYDTIEVFPYWSWWSLLLNTTVMNWGTVSINITINTYSKEDGAWVFIDSQNLSMPASKTAYVTSYWNLWNYDLEKAVYPIKVNATATCENLTDTDEFVFNVKSRVIGDTDGDNDVDVSDYRKLELAMFSAGSGDPIYLQYNSFPVFTDVDGDYDVDVGDARKQSLARFETWPGPIGGVWISVYSPAGSIVVDPPTATLQVGQTITVRVIITNITDCAGLQFWIYYDPALLEYPWPWIDDPFDTDPAHPLSPTQLAPASSDRIDQDSSWGGTVKLLTVWRQGVPRYSYAGSSVAAKLTFEALATGSVRFVFDPVWTHATDNLGNDILFKNLVLRMQSDVDGDRDVDVGDQRKIQLAMFTAYPDPVYMQYNTYPIFTDIDRDEDVDVGDQRIQQLHMFESW